MESSRSSSFREFQEAGLLWLVNRVVFHPRGYALTFHLDDQGAVEGWSMQGDGSEPWSFAAGDDDESFGRLRESGLLR